MTASTHRPPHTRTDDVDDADPSHLPVDPDDGTAPGTVGGDPEADGPEDPTV